MSWKIPYAPSVKGQQAALAAMLRGGQRAAKRVIAARRAAQAYKLIARRAPDSGGELKFLDTANAFTFDTTGEVPATGQLNLIPQNVTESGRIGRKCTIKTIHMKGNINLDPGASVDVASTAYLYVVLDRQANGAAAAITDVMTSANLSTAFRNLSNMGRFKVLKVMRWTLNPTAGVSTAYNWVARSYEFYLKVNIPLEFSGTTGAITEIRSNNVFLLAGTDSLSDDIISLNGATRIRFSDN